MRPLLRFLPMLALLAAPLQVFGGTTATMQVSFTVVASCAVDLHGTAAPGVDCGQSAGFIVTPQASAGGSSISTRSSAGWTVYF